MDMSSSPLLGLNGTMQADSVIYDSMEVDTMRLSVRSGLDNVAYTLQLHNGKKTRSMSSTPSSTAPCKAAAPHSPHASMTKRISSASDSASKQPWRTTA